MTDFLNQNLKAHYDLKAEMSDYLTASKVNKQFMEFQRKEHEQMMKKFEEQQRSLFDSMGTMNSSKSSLMPI
jgi:hypothetical protein